ncbi:MAG: hypothetical protein ACREU7_10520 [Burkholderiales bacterium]
MATATPTLKQAAHALIDQLPDTATWDDVIEEMRFRKAVEEGIAQADRGEFAQPGDVRAAFAKWGVKLET